MRREDALQKAVARLLDTLGLTWFHPANGEARNAITGAKLKGMGVKAGVPDVMIFDAFPEPVNDDIERHLNEIRGTWYFGLAIELKAGKNKPTASQLEWHDRLRKCGWRVEIVYSIDEAIDVLRECYPARFR